MKDAILKINGNLKQNEMKDVIKKMIWYEPNVATSAREIAEMMSKFIEWCIKEVCTDIDENHKIIYFIWFESKATYFKTTDELFIYWYETIYKKQ